MISPQESNRTDMTDMTKETERKPNIRIAAVICLCFLLTSTGYLTWVYRLVNLVRPEMADALSMVAGYILQAAGVGLFTFFMRRNEELTRRVLYAVLILHMLCLLPVVLGNSPVITMFFGFAMNLLCGWIAGYYLSGLAWDTEADNRAVTLGTGYGVSIIASWLLSLIGNGAVYYSDSILIICLVMTAAVFFVIRKNPAAGSETKPSSIQLPKGQQFKGFALLAVGLVLLFSIVNSCGFGFPSASLKRGISLEFSRLFYAAGLIIAGIVNDRSRKYGAVCALAALVFPFIMLALKGESVSLMIFWALSYFIFGFYSVYRIILFSDIARGKDMIWLSGFGLLTGRIGDAVGETLNLTLADHLVILIVITAVLFVAAMFLFFRIQQFLYLPVTERPKPEWETFNQFSAQHDLSPRERQVLRLVLQEKTNMEIAEELSVSESTVKFHIHNLLQKTGCRNRTALLSACSDIRDL